MESSNSYYQFIKNKKKSKYNDLFLFIHVSNKNLKHTIKNDIKIIEILIQVIIRIEKIKI